MHGRLNSKMTSVEFDMAAKPLDTSLININMHSTQTLGKMGETSSLFLKMYFNRYFFIY